LSPALREAAELRRANPSASLDELARLCVPPISKPALADRLRRIVSLADRDERRRVGSG
jgi:cell division protein WhiA